MSVFRAWLDRTARSRGLTTTAALNMWVNYTASVAALLSGILSIVEGHSVLETVFLLTVFVVNLALALYVEFFCSNMAPEVKAFLKNYRPTLSHGSPAWLAVGSAILVLSVVGFASSRVAGFTTLAIAVCVLAFGVEIKLEKRPRPPLPLTPEGHQAALKDISHSTDPEDKGAVLIGFEVDKPDRPAVKQAATLTPAHILFCGRTGTGKSTRGIASWATQQLVRGDTTVVLMMFREDLATYHRVTQCAEDLGIPHALVTFIENAGSHLRNHYLDPAFRAMGPQQRAELMNKARGTSKSEGHGKGFFSDENERIDRISHMMWPDLASPADHRDRLSDGELKKRAGISARQLEKSSHMVAILEKLATISIANQVPGNGLPDSLFEHAVTSYKMIERPGLYTFIVPSLLWPTTGRIFVREELRLIIAALHQLRHGQRVKYVSVYFDDCAPMIEQSLPECLTNARDLGCGLGFGIQSLSDFRNDDIDMRPIVVTNATTQVFFTAIDDDTADYISRQSGTKKITLGAEGRTDSSSPAGQGRSDSRQRRELIVPKIGPNELIVVNNSPDLAIVNMPHAKGGSKLNGATIVAIPAGISEEDFKAANKKPLPSPDGVRTVAGKDLPEWKLKLNAKAKPEPKAEVDAPIAKIIARKSAKSKRDDPERQAASEQAADDLRARQKDRINRMFGDQSAES